MNITVESLPKNTYKLSIVLDETEVGRLKTEVVEELAKKTKMQGFRPGHAPAHLVEEQIDKNTLHREIMEHAVSQYYPQAVKERTLKPISTPRVNIESFDPYTALTFTALIAERPEASIGDYRKLIRERANTITTENSGEVILNILVESLNAEIADMIIEDEQERMLTRLVDQIQQLGTTVERYAQSKNKSIEELKAEYRTAAEQTIRAELAFAKAVEQEKIEIAEEEVQETINANPDEQSKAELGKPENRWYLEMILKRQKLMEELRNVAELAASVKA